MILPGPGEQRRWMQNRPVSGGSDAPNSSAVLIPLVISMVLIFLGVGIALAFYINYRRRYRRWLDDFRERRAREERERVEQEKKDSIGPAWWEVEVGDDDDDEGLGEAEKRAVQAEWNPVSVTYHHEYAKQDDISSPPTPSLAPTPTAPSATPSPSAPEKVEMTVLIAMPSPTPMRSRRTSPASSVPSLDLTPSTTWRSSMSAAEREAEDVELPEVQLATVMIPVKHRDP